MIDVRVPDSFRRVCILCAHTDDEFGCAGTVDRLLEMGAEVKYIALSRCEESVPVGWPQDVLESECRACMEVLGVPQSHIEVHGFKVRQFPANRQDILELFVGVRDSFKPDLVLLPSRFDTHQDHETVCREGFRAFKTSSILGYELPQNIVSFENSAFVRLTEQHVARKISALACYHSQEFRSYSSEDFVRSLARVRGVQCGAEFAEAYEVLRLIV